MITISEHNNLEKSKRFIGTKKHSMGTNIECPKCHNELKLANNSTYLSNPPKRQVKCMCGYVDYILA